MAFNFSRQRRGNASSSVRDDDVVVVDSEAETTSSSNKVATQTWVQNVLSSILGWANSFKTLGLQVQGPAQVETLDAASVESDEIKTSKITLLDANGKTMVLTLGTDGSLSTKYDYENVYIFPTTGVDVRSFFYTSGQTTVQNLYSQNKWAVMDRFIPYVDGDTTNYNGTTCSKLCTADGSDSLIGRTILVTCPYSKLITGLVICDSDMNQKKRIALPENKGVTKLTINMPYFEQQTTSGETTTTTQTFVELPYECVNSNDGSWKVEPPVIPPLPVIQDVNLNPSLFEDTDLFSDEETTTTTSDFSGHLASQTAETLAATRAEPDVKNGSYVTTTYSNVVLKASDFDTNKKQYLAFEVVDNA